MSTTEAPVTAPTDERPRHVVAVLADADGSTVAFDALVNEVLRREYRGDRDPADHRRAVANALHFEILPRFDSRGVLTHDSGRDVVRFDRDRVAAIEAGAESGLDAGPSAAFRPPSPREVTASQRF
ncbi:hypothetical protein ACFO0N_16205 [Halobium salinum]|uniref:DUF7344 domain-containing protein n=1 Tax=Halobium salinum TaxID=1364940 RepID=A0ABD5PFP7_9EURY|nr:hypothetical protein [Halobium salinum]